MRGIRAVCTVVDVIDSTDLPGSRLKAQLDDEVDLAGIHVDDKAVACVYLKVHLLKVLGRNGKPAGFYALDASIELYQPVLLSRSPATKAFAPTWSSDIVATIPADRLDKGVEEVSTELIRKFAAAFRSVNPL